MQTDIESLGANFLKKELEGCKEMGNHLDILSQTSTKNMGSVAAFSAQPSTQVCKSCKRKLSINNCLIPNKATPGVYPFNERTNFIKRVMSGPNFGSNTFQATLGFHLKDRNTVKEQRTPIQAKYPEESESA